MLDAMHNELIRDATPPTSYAINMQYVDPAKRLVLGSTRKATKQVEGHAITFQVEDNTQCSDLHTCFCDLFLIGLSEFCK